MKPRRLALAGTGTDVGKTHYAQRLARCLLRRGFGVCALKPIETGFRSMEDSDAGAVARAAGHPAVRPLFTHPDALGPLAASRRTGTELSLAAMASWIDSEEARWSGPPQSTVTRVTLVETAGGLFTPLTPGATNLDLVRAIEADALVLVARNRLGALHDVLAIHAAIAAEVRLPLAVILNTMGDDAPATNLEDLRLCGVAPAMCDPDDAALTDLALQLLAPA